MSKFPTLDRNFEFDHFAKCGIYSCKRSSEFNNAVSFKTWLFNNASITVMLIQLYYKSLRICSFFLALSFSHWLIVYRLYPWPLVPSCPRSLALVLSFQYTNSSDVFHRLYYIYSIFIPFHYASSPTTTSVADEKLFPGIWVSSPQFTWLKNIAWMRVYNYNYMQYSREVFRVA